MNNTIVSDYFYPHGLRDLCFLGDRLADFGFCARHEPLDVGLVSPENGEGRHQGEKLVGQGLARGPHQGVDPDRPRQGTQGDDAKQGEGDAENAEGSQGHQPVHTKDDPQGGGYGFTAAKT